MSSIIESSKSPSPSVVSMPNSRASSSPILTITKAPFDLASEPEEAKGSNHPRYFFEDGNIVFLVEGTLYNVHRYFFARDSAHFRSALRVKGSPGADEFNPYALSDVTCADFDEFLAILYPTDFLHPTEKSTEQWTSILHLSAKWGFESIKLLAIDRLTAHADPIDKIVLGRRYGIDDWLPGAYEAVCMRADPLTLKEGMKLGVEDTVRISAARQVYGCAKPRHEATYLSHDLREIFGLVKPSEIEKSSDADHEEDVAICELESEIAAVEADLLADPVPPATRCLSQIVIRYNCGHPVYGACGSCASCKPESEERRLKREGKEGKERQVKAYRESREGRREERAKQLGRLVYRNVFSSEFYSPSSLSLMSLKSSRASSPFDVTVIEESVGTPDKLDEAMVCKRHSRYHLKSENVVFLWTSVLHLAAKWGFESIKCLAIENLTETAGPVDKIVLGREYSIDEWLPTAYEAVCTRADSLTMEEGTKLGLETALRISAIRQAYGCGKARYNQSYLKADLVGIFGPEMPSAKGTDIDDAAIKTLEDDLANAQIALLDSPAPPATKCLNNTCECCRCGSCAGCKPPLESNEHRVKREEIKDIERRLKDLQDQRNDSQSMVERPGRISSFR
ncbi:hypothetical protein HWV62_14890 [Athelia sp. TMB]|nr:hypothetical protein HWV62_14890 [Athelia sp. TMB]